MPPFTFLFVGGGLPGKDPVFRPKRPCGHSCGLQPSHRPGEDQGDISCTAAGASHGLFPVGTGIAPGSLCVLVEGQIAGAGSDDLSSYPGSDPGPCVTMG